MLAAAVVNDVMKVVKMCFAHRDSFDGIFLDCMTFCSPPRKYIYRPDKRGKIPYKIMACNKHDPVDKTVVVANVDHGKETNRTKINDKGIGRKTVYWQVRRKSILPDIIEWRV